MKVFLDVALAPDGSFELMPAFASIRTGFPTAKISVLDSSPWDEDAEKIAAASKQIAASYLRLPEEKACFQRLKDVCALAETGPAVYVAPSVQFWSSMEGFTFNSLLAADFYTHPSGCRDVMPSVLFLPRVEKLLPYLPVKNLDAPFMETFSESVFNCYDFLYPYLPSSTEAVRQFLKNPQSIKGYWRQQHAERSNLSNK